MLVIPDRIAASLVTFDEIIAAVARAFRALDDGAAELFDVVRGHGMRPEDFFGIKSGVDGSIGCMGLKAGAYVASAAARGEAAHSSTILLFDARTARPLAIVGADSLNGLRTAAADALATRALARADAQVLGIVGCGHQAVFEAMAVARVRPIASILFWSPTRRNAAGFIAAVRARTQMEPQAVELSRLVDIADVIVTVTPSRAALIAAVRPGTHVSAMGADADGKQELEPALVAAAKTFVDVPAQAALIGECQHACKSGLLDPAVLADRTLGRLLNGKVSGREHADEITVFDSSGMALQDIAVAHLVYERALRRGGFADLSLRDA